MSYISENQVAAEWLPWLQVATEWLPWLQVATEWLPWLYIQVGETVVMRGLLFGVIIHTDNS